MKDYYAALEVSPLASDEEIRKAYRRSVLKYHPDRNQGNTRTVRKMQEINTAFEVLGDPEKRKAYDLEHRFDSQEAAADPQPSPPMTEADQGDPLAQTWLNRIKNLKDQPHESGESWGKKKRDMSGRGSLALYLLLFIWGALAYLFVWLWVKFVD